MSCDTNYCSCDPINVYTRYQQALQWLNACPGSQDAIREFWAASDALTAFQIAKEESASKEYTAAEREVLDRDFTNKQYKLANDEDRMCAEHALTDEWPEIEHILKGGQDE